MARLEARVDRELQRRIGTRVGERLANRFRGDIGDRQRRRRAVRFRQTEQFLQFSTVIHRLHDVGAADQFAVHVQLRDRRPSAVGLDALADFRVGEHVDARVIAEQFIECAGGGRRKSAARRLRRAFHEQHDRMLLQQRFDA